MREVRVAGVEGKAAGAALISSVASCGSAEAAQNDSTHFEIMTEGMLAAFAAALDDIRPGSARRAGERPLNGAARTSQEMSHR